MAIIYIHLKQNAQNEENGCYCFKMCVLKTPEIAFRKLEKYFIIMLKTPEIETFQM